MHSPFVFDFIVNVLNDKKQRACYDEIEMRRKLLLKDNSVIEVEDFGAGSSVIKTNKRRVDKVASSSLKSKKYAQLLHRMVEYYQPKNIIELGTSFGITTSYLSKGNPSATIDTFEGAASIANIAQTTFQQLGLKNIHLHQGDFSKTLNPFLQSVDSVDFAFVDGNHRKEPTIEYFHQLLKKHNDHSIFIFDDIHWSAEMEEAWQYINANTKVTLSIDLFFIGIVFFRNDFKVKQHFSIQF